MLRLNLDASRRSKKEFIELVIEACKPIFNDAMGYDFFKEDNLKIAFCNFENRAAVYEDICKRFFPLYLAEDYDRNSLFTAQAFTNADDGIYGILICLDVEQEDPHWYQIIFHEMSHIFCITHEIGGDNFNAKYPKKTIKGNLHNGNIYVGYGVWREFIADYIAYQINPITAPLSLIKLRDIVRQLDKDINMDNPDRAVCASLVLAYIFVTAKIQKAPDEDTILQTLKRNRIFASKERCELYREIICLIFHQLEEDFFWEITPQFIEKIGLAYLWLPQ